jgi:hypothetical protein
MGDIMEILGFYGLIFFVIAPLVIGVVALEPPWRE